MKPLVKYRGGKSKEIPHIEKHIPDSEQSDLSTQVPILKGRISDYQNQYR